MKTKTFDCVEMKRKAALRIYDETKNLSLDQRIDYWQQKSNEFLRKQQERRDSVQIKKQG